jgi:hypothetical protein
LEYKKLIKNNKKNFTRQKLKICCFLFFSFYRIPPPPPPPSSLMAATGARSQPATTPMVVGIL